MGRRERQRNGPRRGFSIVDLLIAIVILGILATIAYPYIRKRGAGSTEPARLTWVIGKDSALAGDSAEVAVQVQNAAGAVIPGVVVDFQAAVGSGTAAPATATSDRTGMAPVTWHFGDAGQAVLTARVHGQPGISADLKTAVRGAH